MHTKCKTCASHTFHFRLSMDAVPEKKVVQEGTPLCAKTCACHEPLKSTRHCSDVVLAAIRYGTALAQRSRPDFVEKAWMNLVSCVVAVEDARQRAAMLSARYAVNDMGGTCSLLWMTISWKGLMAEDLVVTRIQWLLAQGACVEQGYVYASVAMVCRPSCAASREGAFSLVLQKAGFCPLFASTCKMGIPYPATYVASWPRWHQRCGRRGWCALAGVCVVSLTN